MPRTICLRRVVTHLRTLTGAEVVIVVSAAGTTDRTTGEMSHEMSDEMHPNADVVSVHRSGDHAIGIEKMQGHLPDLRRQWVQRCRMPLVFSVCTAHPSRK